MNISWIGAHPNNYMVGRNGQQVRMIVLHWMAGTLQGTDATFNDGRRRASAHYGIAGPHIHQYVKEDDTAYANGNFAANLESISIEHEGGPNIPISEQTYQTSIQLVATLCQRYGIPPDSSHIKRHRDFTATQCPGSLDVERIIREAAALLAPPPLKLPAFNDQTKIPAALLNWSEDLEIQAIRGLLGDLLKTKDLLAGAIRDLTQCEIALLEAKKAPKTVQPTFSNPIANLVFQLALLLEKKPVG